MSAPSRRRLTIEERARRDIEDVLLYTQERWSADQRRRYRAKLTQQIRSLLIHPERGLTRDELYFGCRSLAVERHVVFYRIEGDEIIVGRVLHVSQDPVGKVVP